MNQLRANRRIFIKMCGFTRAGDAVIALEAGADAIGLNFFAGPRRIDLPTAHEIIRAVGSPDKFVALVSATPKAGALAAAHIFESLGIRTFQLYNLPESGGHAELPQDAEHLCYWPVVRVGERRHLAGLGQVLGGFGFTASALLLDSFAIGAHGGTGEVFNWQWIADAQQHGELGGLPPLLLAGGLNPANVGEAVRIAQPWGVDVASGIETCDARSGKKGEKDADAMRAFIRAVRAAELRK